jgi:hypothetical protein
MPLLLANRPERNAVHPHTHGDDEYRETHEANRPHDPPVIMRDVQRVNVCLQEMGDVIARGLTARASPAAATR